MHIKNIILYILLIIVSFSCSKKVNLSTRAIDRPLSLPNNYFGLGIGAEANYSDNSGRYKRENILPTISNLTIPYFKINDDIELHAFMPRMRFQIINTDTVINNTLIMQSKNWVSDLQLTGINISSDGSFSLSYGISTSFLSKINNKFWYNLNPFLDFTNFNKYNYGLDFNLGCQILNKVYLTINLMMYANKDYYAMYNDIIIDEYNSLTSGINSQLGFYPNPKIHLGIGVGHYYTRDFTFDNNRNNSSCYIYYIMYW